MSFTYVKKLDWPRHNGVPPRDTEARSGPRMHSVRYPANSILSRLFACQPEVNGCQRVGFDKVDTLSSPPCQGKGRRSLLSSPTPACSLRIASRQEKRQEA